MAKLTIEIDDVHADIPIMHVKLDDRPIGLLQKLVVSQTVDQARPTIEIAQLVYSEAGLENYRSFKPIYWIDYVPTFMNAAGEVVTEGQFVPLKFESPLGKIFDEVFQGKKSSDDQA